MREFIHHSNTSKLIINIITILLLIVSIGLSVSYGSTNIALGTVWQAVFHFDPELTTHQVIQELRLPRAFSAALVGAFLAVSGAIMQGMTRNPLASPSIMGVTDGAAFALVLMLAFFPTISTMGLIGSSFIGAGLAVGLVFMVGSFSPSGLTPVKLALAGVAIGTMLRSISSILSLHFNLEKTNGLLACWWSRWDKLGLCHYSGYFRYHRFIDRDCNLQIHYRPQLRRRHGNRLRTK